MNSRIDARAVLHRIRVLVVRGGWTSRLRGVSRLGRASRLSMANWIGRAGQVGREIGRGARWLTPRWVRRWAGRFTVLLVGAALGLFIGGHTTRQVGPFDARLDLTPNVRGDSVVRIPPLGTLELDSHDGPLRLDVELQRLRQAEAQELLRDPAKLAGIGDQAAADVRSAIIWLVIKAAASAVAGAAVLSVFVYRRKWREPVIAGGLASVLLAGTAGGAYATWRPDAITEPRYTGLLTNAPALVGDARSIVNQLDVYRDELAGLITNVSKLYTAATTLPAFQPDDSTIRVLHVSDLHLSPTAYQLIKSIVDQFRVNAVADTGDLTDFGSEPEAQYVSGIQTLGVPYVYIRGNHDSVGTAAAVAAQPNAIVLDGVAPVEVVGLTFLGKGDPRFTPDKETRDDEASVEKVQSPGEELKLIVDDLDAPPDVTLLHDPLSAIALKDEVPLILAGHAHKREAERLGDTLVLVEGSTGGAGLRGLEGEEPTSIECSVLYFDATTKQLQARDDITLGGIGETEVTIERHQVGDEPQAGQ